MSTEQNQPPQLTRKQKRMQDRAKLKQDIQEVMAHLDAQRQNLNQIGVAYDSQKAYLYAAREGLIKAAVQLASIKERV